MPLLGLAMLRRSWRGSKSNSQLKGNRHSSYYFLGQQRDGGDPRIAIMQSPSLNAFVNSQEWTMSRAVPELKLGVVGHSKSGKASLVHRFLTGAYSAEESPEGGRFKKELVIDDQSYLVLIRDEGGVPEQQFAHWVDAIIFVFSLDSLDSFETVQVFYNQMSKFRNLSEIPLIVVGTQDAITETTPRMIKESAVKNFSHGLRRCAYFEACATYGLNVEKVFRDACQRIIQQRVIRSLGAAVNNTRTPTPTTAQQHSDRDRDNYQLHNHAFVQPSLSSSSSSHQKAYHQRSASVLPSSAHEQSSRLPSRTTNGYPPPQSPVINGRSSIVPFESTPVLHRENAAVTSALRNGERTFSAFAMPSAPQPPQQLQHPVAYTNRVSDYGPLSPTSYNSTSNVVTVNSLNGNGGAGRTSTATMYHYGIPTMYDHPSAEQWDGQMASHPSTMSTGHLPHATASTSHLPTPSSTPTAQRKNRRISNIFQRPKDHHNDEKARGLREAELSMGVGRAIPLKQGHLYKRSSKSLNKEWKKKYVCLYSDGRLSYHQNLKDYMDKEPNGKEVYLGLATVRVAGRRPRGAQQRALTQPIAGSALKENNHTGNKRESLEPSHKLNLDLAAPGGENRLSLANGMTTPGGDGTSAGSDEGANGGGGLQATPLTTATSSAQQKKKRGHRRLGSSAKHNDDDDECCEFEIVSCDQKRWEFSATSPDERDEWVAAIEAQIERALQAQSSQKPVRNGCVMSLGDKMEVQALRQLPGNANCADCGAPRPDWASLNLGTLICIECSGIHRNLGSHLSRVRSLELDDWPTAYLSVMQAIGNDTANRLWEHNAPRDRRPTPESSRDTKEAWIRAKYELKRYLPPIPTDRTLGRQLIDAVLEGDPNGLMNILPRCSEEDINAVIGSRDKRTALHLACSTGSTEFTQLLLWSNADIRALDESGRSALWYAQNAGSRSCAAVLMNAGLQPNYGIPELNGAGGAMQNGQLLNSHGQSESVNGSSSSSQVAIGLSHDNNLARLRRCSDVISNNTRMVQPASRNSISVTTANKITNNNTAALIQQRASDAFERLPASII